MVVDAVIPARFGSTRFPGKALARIAGIPMVERVYRRVEAAGCFRRILVATDDERIARVVEGFGGLWKMTDSHHSSGTERVYAAVKGDVPDGVVNIQGDEPLIAPELIQRLTTALAAGDCPVATAAYANRSPEDFLSPHVVKVVRDRLNRALYFSRAPLPAGNTGKGFSGFLQHVGVYAYRSEALERFVTWAPGPLEVRERLEQLRFLENGVSLLVVDSAAPSHGVDVEADIARIEAILQENS